MLSQWVQLMVPSFFGGGIFWKLFSPAPGPAIDLTSSNTVRNDKYPRLLEIENVGDKAAHNVQWEIREYCGTVLPSYEPPRRDKHIAPLKPGERLAIEVGSESADLALLTHFEIVVTYLGPNRAKFRSYFTVDGNVKRNDSGLNRTRWLFTCPWLRVWVQQLCGNMRIHARVKTRRSAARA
jgi:hypothetical protein